MNKNIKEIIPILKKKSDFFCPAKWNELYLYLNHGTSNSCHHPIPHAIPVELLDTPSRLHNTPHKLEMQQLMMNGIRPDECHMCWHIEDLGEDVVSDRFHKSIYWQKDIANLQVDVNYVPKLIEIVFDNTCNLMCSYCDPGQSSSWATQISKTPFFLKTDYRHLYNKVTVEPGKTISEFYLAWEKWWPQIKDKVEVLRISGGEPLLSKNFWVFVDTLENCKSLKLGINSNFSVNTTVIEKFITKTKHLEDILISASIDAVENIAEYTRQGLNYETFTKNIKYFCEQTPDNFSLRLQSTVNILSVWGITDKFDLIIKLREKYPDKIKDGYSTIVRFPEFQSVSLLPTYLKENLVKDLNAWIEVNKQYLYENECSYLYKIIAYLQSNPQSFKDLAVTKMLADLKKFLKLYDKSSKHKFNETFPQSFVIWVNNLI